MRTTVLGFVVFPPVKKITWSTAIMVQVTAPESDTLLVTHIPRVLSFLWVVSGLIADGETEPQSSRTFPTLTELNSRVKTPSSVSLEPCSERRPHLLCVWRTFTHLASVAHPFFTVSPGTQGLGWDPGPSACWDCMQTMSKQGPSGGLEREPFVRENACEL